MTTLMRLALLVPWLGTWLFYREHKRTVARMESLLHDAEARVAALESQRDALVGTLDTLYAAEIDQCKEPA